MNKDVVTILMATYNGEKYLQAQLDSLQQQSYKNWKLIVGDDGSTDGTIALLSKFRQECPHSVEIIKNVPPTGSAKANFMQLLSKADTPYIMFCDQDDIWMPDKVSLTLAAMKDIEKNKSVPILIHSDLTVLGENGVIAESFFDYQNLPADTKLSSLIIQNSVTGCTVMINESLKNKMLETKDYSKIIMHDYWAVLIAKVYGEVGFLNSPTMYYRQHSENSVGAKESGNLLYLIRRLRQGRKSYKGQLEESMMQISLFLQTYKKYPMNKEERKLLEGYASLIHQNKFYRMWFYFRNKVCKQGVIRVLMQYIWG